MNAEHETLAGVYARIRDLLEGPVADPHELAAQLAKELDSHELIAAATVALVELVKAEIHRQRARMRGRTLPGSRRQAAPTPAGGSGGAKPSERWQEVSRVTLNPARMRYVVNGVWRFLEDLTADDCRVLARDYGDLAARNSEQARRFNQLAALLESRRLQVAGDLPAEELQQVLGGRAA